MTDVRAFALHDPDAFDGGGVTLASGRYVQITPEHFDDDGLILTADPALTIALEHFTALKPAKAPKDPDPDKLLGAPPALNVPSTRAEMEGMRANSLKHVARAKGVAVTAGMKKEDLIDALVNLDEAAANEAPEEGALPPEGVAEVEQTEPENDEAKGD